MKTATPTNLEFEQTLFLLRSSLIKAKNLLEHSGESEESFNQTLKAILETKQVDDSLKIKLFLELDTISNLIKKLLQIDRKVAEYEVGKLLLEILKLKHEDSKKILKGILIAAGEK